MRAGAARPGCQICPPTRSARPGPWAEGTATALGLAFARSTLVACALLLANASTWAQPGGADSGQSRPGRPLSTARNPSPPALAAATTPDSRSEAGPAWGELSADQQAVLRPLAGSWAGLNADQKRKWVAISRNHDKLSPDGRARLQGRMSNWATLTPAERAQARLNYAQSRERSAQDKSAQWEAYQALSPEQKKELARQQPAKPSGASVASTGTPRLRLAPAAGNGAEQAPRNPGQRRSKPKLVAGDNLDANTLLPQQAPERRKNPRP
jgi:hypothetical protein